MFRNGAYIVFGYLCGSILFARVFAELLGRGDITRGSADGNPGTANAFLQGGFLCGLLTLCGDLAKGFLPVHMYLNGAGSEVWNAGLAVLIAAPVIGHILPVFYKFRGGKGIAVTFGCLLGLSPYLYPVWILAFVFLFFSLVIRITPHYNRTIFTYWCTELGMLLLVKNTYVVMAFTLITLAVSARMHFSHEKREKCKVRVLWMH